LCGGCSTRLIQASVAARIHLLKNELNGRYTRATSPRIYGACAWYTERNARC